MKETDIWLNQREIHALLQGAIQWEDVNSQENRDQTRAIMKEKLLSEVIEDGQKTYEPLREASPYRRLEGRPVIWLLGGVGLLTGCSWFYYVLLA